jgi:O-antigen ligase
MLREFGRTEPVNRQLSLRFRILAFVEHFTGRAGLLLVISIALVVALMLTASRAGIVSAFAGCMTLAVLRMRKRRRGQAGLPRFSALAIISILFLVALELSGSTVSARLMDGDLESGGRLDVYRMTLKAIAENFWMGTGFGTFQDAFPVFRDDILTYGLIWDKAHNDYLELVLGLGVPAAVLFLLGVAILIARTVRGYFSRRRDSIFCCVAVSVSAIAIAHSLLDFSMQIQAIAMAYSMLLALGVAQSRSSRKLVAR